MATKIVFCPPLSKTIMDVARGMVPAGYELEVLDQPDPRFAAAMQEAEYFMGFARGGMGPEFYRGAPLARPRAAYHPFLRWVVSPQMTWRVPGVSG